MFSKFSFRRSIIFLLLYLSLWALIDIMLLTHLPKGFALPTLSNLWGKHKNVFTLINDYNFWSTWLGIVLQNLFEIGLLSVLFFIFCRFYKFTLSFGKSIIVVILSHAVFLLQFICEFFFITNYPAYFESIRREKFSLFSLSYFFNVLDIKFHSIFEYLFQTLSIFEILYWLLLSFFIAKGINKKFAIGVKVVASSYIPLLFIWLLAISFLTLMNS